MQIKEICGEPITGESLLNMIEEDNSYYINNSYFEEKLLSAYEKMEDLKLVLGDDIVLSTDIYCKNSSISGKPILKNKRLAIWKKADEDNLIKVYFSSNKINLDTALKELLRYMDNTIANGGGNRYCDISTGTYNHLPTLGLKFAMEDFWGKELDDKSFKKIVRTAYKYETSSSKKYEKIINRQKKEKKDVVQSYDKTIKKQKNIISITVSILLLMLMLVLYLVLFDEPAIPSIDDSIQQDMKKTLKGTKNIINQSIIQKELRDHIYEK